jgi:hypothetical protein
VLRGHVAGAAWWIFARALAWGVGLPLLMFAASVIAHASSAPPLVLLGIVLTVFAAIAAIVGAIEGLAMDRLLAHPPHRAGAASASARA